MPKEQPAPVKEQPVAPEPIMQPKKPYLPKMPKPILPDIDINNYFMMNMPNVNVHQPAKEQPKPLPKEQPKPLPKEQPKSLPKEKPNIPIPQLPQMPVNIFPEVIEEVEQIKENVKPVKEMKPIVKPSLRKLNRLHKNLLTFLLK